MTLATRPILAAAALAGALTVGLAGGASAAVTSAPASPGAAAPSQGFVLAPTEERCVTQFATSSFHAVGSATKDGARFRVKLNGATLFDSFGRVSAFVYDSPGYAAATTRSARRTPPRWARTPGSPCSLGADPGAARPGRR